MKAYKTELDPNATQRQALLRNAGAARWVYNWALARNSSRVKLHPTKQELRTSGRTMRKWFFSAHEEDGPPQNRFMLGAR